MKRTPRTRRTRGGKENAPAVHTPVSKAAYESGRVIVRARPGMTVALIDGVGKDATARIVDMTPDYCIAEGLEDTRDGDTLPNLYAIYWRDVMLLGVLPDRSVLYPRRRGDRRRP